MESRRTAQNEREELLPSFKAKARRRSSLSRGRRSSVNYSQANVDYADLRRDIPADLPETERLILLTDKCFEFAVSKIPELDEETIERIRIRYKEKICGLRQSHSDAICPQSDKRAQSGNDEREQMISDYESYEESLQNESEKWEIFRNESQRIDGTIGSFIDQTDFTINGDVSERNASSINRNRVNETKRDLLVHLEAAESVTKQIASTCTLFENITATETARLRNDFVSKETEIDDKTAFRRVLDRWDKDNGGR